MKISREWLIEMMGEKDVDVLDEVSGNSRWSISHRRIVRLDGKFYEANYSVGATEYQDEGPYEYSAAEIECPEVFPVQKLVTVYERSPQPTTGEAHGK